MWCASTGKGRVVHKGRKPGLKSIACRSMWHKQTAEVGVSLLVWSWGPPVGWHNTLQDTMGGGGPICHVEGCSQTALSKLLWVPQCMPYGSVSETRTHSDQVSTVGNNTEWPCSCHPHQVLPIWPESKAFHCLFFPEVFTLLNNK